MPVSIDAMTRSMLQWKGKKGDIWRKRIIVEVKLIDREDSPSEWENGLHTDVGKQGVNRCMGEDEKWSSECEDGIYVNGGDVATENFFGI